MASIDQQQVLQALDENFSPDDIRTEMVNQGIDTNSASEAIRGAISTQVPRMLDEASPEEVTTFLRSEKGFSDEFMPKELTVPQPELLDQDVQPANALPDAAGVEARLVGPTEAVPLAPLGQDSVAEQPKDIFMRENRSPPAEPTKAPIVDRPPVDVIKDDVLNEVQNPNSTRLANNTPEQQDAVIESIKVADATFLTSDEGAKDLASKAQNIAQKYNTIKVVGSVFGNAQSKADLAQDSAEVTEFVYQTMKKNGFEMHKIIGLGSNKETVMSPGDPRIDNMYLNAELAFTDKDGNIKVVTTGLLRDLNNSRLELGGAIVGATAGAAAAAQIPIPPVTPPTAIAKLLVIGAGGLVGGAAGAFTGRGLDIAINSMLIKEEIDSARALDQMLDAGYTDAIFTVGGGLAIKGGIQVVKATYGLAGKAASGVQSLTKQVGTSDAKAEITLQRVLNLSDKQSAEIVQEWATINSINVDSLTRSEKLAVVATSANRGSVLVAAAASRDASVANKIASSIDQRTKELLKLSSSLTDPNITRKVSDDLATYSADINAVHAASKVEGQKLMKGVEFKFDYNKEILAPLNRKLSKEIQNPAKFTKVSNFMSNLGKTSGKKDFKALLDSRTLIRDFVRANPDLDAVQKGALEKSIAKLDKLAKDQASKTPEGKAWLAANREAIRNRDKLFLVKNNLLTKALSKEGTSSDDVIKQLAKFMRAEDGTFVHVMSTLDKATADKVEVEVANLLINNHTVGDVAGVQAVKFQELFDEMAKYSFKSEDAKSLKQLVNQMSAVYKNDVVLSSLSGRVVGAGGTSGIGTNLLMRARVQFSNNLYQSLSKFKPTKRGGEEVLVNKIGKVLENPLDTNSVEALFREIEIAASKSNAPFDRGAMGDTLKNLQIEAVKKGVVGRPDIPRTVIYKAAKVGKERTVKNGPLGFGVYYKLDRKGASSSLTSAQERVSSREVPNYRIADEEFITRLLEPATGGKVPTAGEIKANQAFIKEELEAKGYMGFRFNQDMVLFN